jgi:hypothetical protein
MKQTDAFRSPFPGEIDEWRQRYHGLAHTPRQRQAQAILRELDILRHLAPFDPLLIGTIPLGIDTPKSDLDVACHAPDLAHFCAEADRLFGGQAGFRSKMTEKRGVPSAVVSFLAGGEPGDSALEVEFFAQPLPLDAQYGVRHALVEGRLLDLGGEALAQAVRTLKGQGIPTEPAFARLLNLPGDPYNALWQLSLAEEETLRRLLATLDRQDR